MCQAKYFQQVWKNSTSKSAKTSLLGFKVILTMLNTRWSLFWKFHTKFPPLASAHICHRKHNTSWNPTRVWEQEKMPPWTIRQHFVLSTDNSPSFQDGVCLSVSDFQISPAFLQLSLYIWYHFLQKLSSGIHNYQNIKQEVTFSFSLRKNDCIITFLN